MKRINLFLRPVYKKNPPQYISKNIPLFYHKEQMHSFEKKFSHQTFQNQILCLQTYQKHHNNLRDELRNCCCFPIPKKKLLQYNNNQYQSYLSTQLFPYFFYMFIIISAILTITRFIKICAIFFCFFFIIYDFCGINFNILQRHFTTTLITL